MSLVLRLVGAMLSRVELLVYLIIASFAIAAVAQATECRRVVRVQQAVVQHVAVTPVVAAVFAPVAVTVPAYSIGYAAPAPVPDPVIQQLLTENKNLSLRVEALTAQVQSMTAGGPQALKKEAVGEHPAVPILKNKCASCHGAAAKEKGGGFVLMDGQAFAPMTDLQLLNIARNVFSGRMPKNGKLTDEEVGLIMHWLDTQKGVEKIAAPQK